MSQKMCLRVVGAVLLVASVVFLVLGLTSGGPRARITGAMDVSMQAREYVMSGVYKVYALKGSPAGIWVAKAVFQNNTGAPVENLKVRYKLEGFSDWDSWHVYKRLVPTQTVVDTYYPLLSDRCGKQTNRTPTELTMEYEYTDASGKKHSDSMSKRLTMLGVHEIVYRTLPLEEVHGEFQEFFANPPRTAEGLTPDDKAAGGLAALANERALGAGASIDDESCVKVMREAYEIMRAINITYQSPGGGGSNFGDKSFDPMLVQSIQYPRDTIRKRTGTCIELAILYASMLKSQGIKPYLVMLPGHCFPIGQLPKSGGFVPVESTGVGGGGRNSVDFDKAVEIGQKQWNELLKTGEFMLVDVEECIEMGIVPPDLEPLPDDILQRWKITDMLGVGTAGGTGGARGTGGAVQPPPPPPPPSSIQPGDWSVVVASGQNRLNAVAKVQTQGNQVVIVFGLQYTQTDARGVVHQFEEINRFDGTIQGNIITAQCRQAIWKMDGQNVTPNLPIDLRLQVAADGRSAQGIASGTSGQAQIMMQWTK